MSKDLLTIDVADIEYSEEFNCRGRIQPVSCRELAASIKEEGLQQPVVVAPKDDGTYKLIIGHRRFIAITKILRRKKIQAIVSTELADPHKAKIINLTENIQRVDLSLFQELKSINSMVDLGITKEEIAQRCGKSKGWVLQREKISQLPPLIQKELDEGLLKMTQVNTLHDYAGLKDKTKIFSIAREMKHKNMNHRNFDAKKYLSRTNQKTIRTRKEIQAMLGHFLEYFESNLTSRMLAWAGGEIDDKAIHGFIEQYAQDNDWELITGIDTYERPF